MTKLPRITVYIVLTAVLGTSYNKPCFAIDTSGFQYWSTADFHVNLDKDWTATFQEKFKLGDGGGHLYYHHSDVGFVYKGLADWIDLGFNFRKLYEEDRTNTWRHENRPHINVTLKGKLGDIGVSNRSRLEYRDNDKKEDIWRYRNKVTFKLPFELTELKLKPYLADEVFINVNEEGYSGNRLYAGLSFSLAKNIKARVYYVWQSFRASPGRDNIHALGTNLILLF
ncbi:MAG: DUF2490 domain-containing protein [Planctomycetota bacterium]